MPKNRADAVGRCPNSGQKGGHLPKLNAKNIDFALCRLPKIEKASESTLPVSHNHLDHHVLQVLNMDFEIDIEDYGYPTQATIDLPHTEFPGGHWIEDLASFDDEQTGVDPATGAPIYEGDRCLVYYDCNSCPYVDLSDIPF